MIDTELHEIRLPTRVAGHVALDFTNTAEFRGSARFIEQLTTVDHLLAFFVQTALLPAAQARTLHAYMRDQPGAAAQLVADAIALRESLYAAFATVAVDHALSAHLIAPLNTALARFTPHRRLALHEQRYVWEWHGAPQALVLGPIVLAAATLLASDDLARVRQCPNCGWLFVDTSRNHRRRWCSMDACGSKIKSQRQYQRRKATHQPT